MNTGIVPEHRLFAPHSGLSKKINHSIIQSEIEGGVYLNAVPEGATLELQTQNRRYRILNQGQGQVLISGHPEFCPSPRPASIHGSTWGGSMIKLGFIGRGMHLEFAPADGELVTTSRIVDLWEV